VIVVAMTIAVVASVVKLRRDRELAEVPTLR